MNELIKEVKGLDERKILLKVGASCTYILGGKVSTLNTPMPAKIETILNHSVIVRDLIHGGTVEVPFELCFPDVTEFLYNGYTWKSGFIYEFNVDGCWFVGVLSSISDDAIWFNGGMESSDIRLTLLSIGDKAKVKPKSFNINFKF